MLELPSQILDLFTPKERIIVDYLTNNQNKFVSICKLAECIYSVALECDVPENEDAVVRTFVYRIRQKLNGYPYRISYKYHEGYRIVAQDDIQSLNQVVQIAIMDVLRKFTDKQQVAKQLGISSQQLDSFLEGESININIQKTAQTIHQDIIKERGVGGKARVCEMKG